MLLTGFYCKVLRFQQQGQLHVSALAHCADNYNVFADSSAESLQFIFSVAPLKKKSLNNPYSKLQSNSAENRCWKTSFSSATN